jgi:hypothetical protein
VAKRRSVSTARADEDREDRNGRPEKANTHRQG